MPEPDGPRSATSFPRGTFRSTPSSAVKAPKVLRMLEAWMLIDKSGLAALRVAPLDQGLEHQRDDGQQG